MNTNDTIGKRLGQIMDESTRLARAAWLAALAYVVVLTGVGMFVDQTSDLSASNFIFSAISIAMGFVLTVQLLREGGLVPRGLAGGFGGYFGTSLLSGLGIVLGTLLLIIPGLVLFVRWSPAYGYVLGEGEGVTDALGKAWAATGAHFWPLLLAFLPAIALTIGGTVIYILGSNDDGTMTLAASAFANLAVTLGAAAITVVGIASYALLRDRGEALAEVFA
jgi:hypothetical protein